MSRQKNALAHLASVMQKLVQSESEAETISLQPDWFLERAELNLPSFPYQQLSFHFHLETMKWLHEEEQWLSALVSERNVPLENVCIRQGPGEFQVQDSSSRRRVVQPCLFLLAVTSRSVHGFVTQGKVPELCCPEVVLRLGHRDMIDWLHRWAQPPAPSDVRLVLLATALTKNYIVSKDVRHWVNKTTL